MGLKVTDRCALTFKTVMCISFTKWNRTLGSSLATFSLSLIQSCTTTDSIWLHVDNFEGKRIEDLLAGLTTVSDIVQKSDFLSQFIGPLVFEFQGGGNKEEEPITNI